MIGKAGLGVAACALLLAAAAGCSGGAAFSRYCDDTGCYACEGEGNLLPPILAAIEAHATIGEICQAMEDVFGVYEGAP